MPSALDPPTDTTIHVWRVELVDGGREAARAALGELLAAYLGTAEAPGLAAGPEGKPRLAQAPGRLSFNLSHTAGLALVAVAPGEVEVGVDVELVKPRRDLPRLAARWLPEGDAAAVAAAAEDERERVFYAAWTRHEARVKCTGAGLAGPVPGAEVRAYPLAVGPGHAAAVALDAFSASPASPTAATAVGPPKILLRDAACRR